MPSERLRQSQGCVYEGAWHGTSIGNHKCKICACEMRSAELCELGVMLGLLSVENKVVLQDCRHLRIAPTVADQVILHSDIRSRESDEVSIVPRSRYVTCPCPSRGYTTGAKELLRHLVVHCRESHLGTWVCSFLVPPYGVVETLTRRQTRRSI